MALASLSFAILLPGCLSFGQSDSEFELEQVADGERCGAILDQAVSLSARYDNLFERYLDRLDERHEIYRKVELGIAVDEVRKAQLDGEVAALQQELDQIETQIPRLVDEYRAAGCEATGGGRQIPGGTYV